MIIRSGSVITAVITLNLENDSSGETPLETTMMVTYTTRGGKSVVADAVALAYMSGALKDMLAVMHTLRRIRWTGIFCCSQLLNILTNLEA